MSSVILIDSSTESPVHVSVDRTVSVCCQEKQLDAIDSYRCMFVVSFDNWVTVHGVRRTSYVTLKLPLLLPFTLNFNVQAYAVVTSISVKHHGEKSAVSVLSPRTTCSNSRSGRRLRKIVQKIMSVGFLPTPVIARAFQVTLC